MLDMAATTVDDTIVDRPLVLHSFAESFAAAQIAVPWEVLNTQRGKDKLEVFRTLLASHGGLSGAPLEHTAQTLLQDFTSRLLRNVAQLREMPGATATFTFLKAHRVFVALGSGFPLAVTQAIARHCGWTGMGLVDYVTCGEAAGRGRPQPHMINRALQAAGLLPAQSPVGHAVPGFDYRQVLKVGDTVQDVTEGVQVGALTIAVASGTQPADLLAQAGAAAVLPSIADLPDYLLAKGYVQEGAQREL
jgi:phosphonatase-like hydrolase